jgi:hypothetical protein
LPRGRFQRPHASALEPLSDADARFYRAAFAAADHGDFDAAEAAAANARDRSLRGRLEFSKDHASQRPCGQL